MILKVWWAVWVIFLDGGGKFVVWQVVGCLLFTVFLFVVQYFIFVVW